jgi:hypothetical protein
MEAVEQLSNAYNNVFLGNPTKAEQQMVLADLECESGFVQVVIPGPDVSLEYETGKRFLFGRIFRFLKMSAEEHDELHKAARMEAMVNSQEGTII